MEIKCVCALHAIIVVPRFHHTTFVCPPERIVCVFGVAN
jgi:hypothetical protein